MSSNIALPFLRSLELHPGRLALYAHGDEWTYGELGVIVKKIAGWIGQGAAGEGRKVGILASRSLEACAGILGVGWSGSAYVPLSVKQPPAALAQLFGVLGLDAIICDAEGARLLLGVSAISGHRLPKRVLVPDAVAREWSFVKEITRWGDLTDEMLHGPAEMYADSIAYIEFTSGSTGAPKGVMVPCGAVNAFCDFAEKRYAFEPEDRFAGSSDITFDLSVFDMFCCWRAGASLHIVPSNVTIAPGRFLNERGVTVCLTVPSVAAMMSRMGLLQPASLPAVRWSLFCGEPLPAASAQAWRIAAPNSAVENLYGPTEATVACLYEPIGEQTKTTPERAIVAIGRPFENGMRAMIVDERMTQAPRRAPGELALAGPQLALGYYNAPEKTSARFVPIDGDRWYLTGDLAYEDDEGTFHHLGRVDNQIKVLGHRVELEAVESHLRQHLATDSAAAVAWPVSFGAASGIIGFVTGEAHLGEARATLRKHMPPHMVPNAIHRVPELPLTPNGKVDRKALTRMLEEGKFESVSRG
ncbi:MAG TPA: AMP-binding protein [Terriglobales bacterium]